MEKIKIGVYALGVLKGKRKVNKNNWSQFDVVDKIGFNKENYIEAKREKIQNLIDGFMKEVSQVKVSFLPIVVKESGYEYDPMDIEWVNFA